MKKPEILAKRITLILFLTVLLFGSASAPVFARAKRHATRQSSVWQRNPFVPLLKPRRFEAASRRSPQAAVNQEFALSPALELKAIIRNDGNYKAIIGTRLVVPGDRVEGYQVATVEPNRVVLLKGGKPLELTLSPIVATRQSFVIKAAK